jgi:hypothetical protein
MQDGRSSSIASGDWLDQVNKRHDIFGNAVTTIAASESFNGEQGFIHPRNPLSQTTCKLFPDTELAYEVAAPCTRNCLAHAFDSARCILLGVLPQHLARNREEVFYHKSFSQWRLVDSRAGLVKRMQKQSQLTWSFGL